jgi:hypothetical protein
MENERMIRIPSALAALLVFASLLPAANPAKCTVKAIAIPPAKELAEPVRALLGDAALQIVEGDKPVCDLWLRKELPLKAGADASKGYAAVEESTVVGAIRFHQEWSSFRKQKVKAGVYTLRMAIQPMDGDHMGTAPYNEFLLLAPAAADQKPVTMQAKAMFEISAKTIPGTTHPVMLLLFPNPKPDDAPKLADKGNNVWVLNCKEATAKGALGLGLTLFGASESE